MQARRCQADQHVTHPHIAPVDDRITLDDPDREARQIEIAAAVQTRHLGGVTTDQSTAGLATGRGNARDQRHGIDTRVVTVPPRALPRTSSGKLSRAGARKLYLEGAFERADGSVP